MDNAHLSPTERRKDFQRRIADIEPQHDAAVAELRAIYIAKKTAVQGALPDDVKGARAVARAFLNGFTPDRLAESHDVDRESHLIRLRDGAELALHELRKREADAAWDESVAKAGEHAQQLRACCHQAVLAAVMFDAAWKRFEEMKADLVPCTPLPFSINLGLYGEDILEALAGDRIEFVIKNAIEQKIITAAEAKGAKNVK